MPLLTLERQPLPAGDAPRRRALRVLVDLDLPCNHDCVECPRRHRHPPPWPRGFGALAEQLLGSLAEDPTDQVAIAFYGGEPLLAADALCDLAARLREGATALGVRWSAGVLTNGTLLDARQARKLSIAGINAAQATLLGPRRHDGLRAFPGGEPTFDRILDNVAGARGAIAWYLRAELGRPDDLGEVAALLRSLDTHSVSRDDASVCVVVQPRAGYPEQARVLCTALSGSLRMAQAGVDWLGA